MARSGVGGGRAGGVVGVVGVRAVVGGVVGLVAVRAVVGGGGSVAVGGTSTGVVLDVAVGVRVAAGRVAVVGSSCFVGGVGPPVEVDADGGERVRRRPGRRVEDPLDELVFGHLAAAGHVELGGDRVQVHPIRVVGVAVSPVSGRECRPDRLALERERLVVRRVGSEAVVVSGQPLGIRRPVGVVDGVGEVEQVREGFRGSDGRVRAGVVVGYVGAQGFYPFSLLVGDLEGRHSHSSAPNRSSASSQLSTSRGSPEWSASTSA